MICSNKVNVLTIPILNREMNINSKMELFIRGSGEVQAERVMVCRYGQMELSISDYGKKTKLMVRDNSSMLMVMFMKVTGSKIKLTETEDTNTQMEQCTRVSGNSTFKMDSAWKNGLMAQHFKERTKTV